VLQWSKPEITELALEPEEDVLLICHCGSGTPVYPGLNCRYRTGTQCFTKC